MASPTSPGRGGTGLGILDVVFRRWIIRLVCTGGSSMRVGVAFTAALAAEELLAAAEARAPEALRAARCCGERERVARLTGEGRPPPLVILDNGRRRRGVSTRQFLVGVGVARRFDRAHTRGDQARIEALFGRVKGEWPHPEKIKDPGGFGRGLERARAGYDTVRLHAGLG
jgi:putative transposase